MAVEAGSDTMTREQAEKDLAFVSDMMRKGHTPYIPETANKIADAIDVLLEPREGLRLSDGSLEALRRCSGEWGGSLSPTESRIAAMAIEVLDLLPEAE